AKEGLLAVADGGTVFLDEIAELPVDLQAKLLRAIQEREIRPVGSTRRMPIKVRILAATNRDLERGVAEGTFRRDLYYRLNVLTLRIPPLRDRKQDIPLLAEHFLEKLARVTGSRRTLSDEALKALLAYDWPGNVRELENFLERAVAISSGSTLHLVDLPTAVQNALQLGGGPGIPPKIVPLAQLEREAIINAIEQLHGDKLQAARLLGIGKTTLYRKLKEYSAEQDGDGCLADGETYGITNHDSPFTICYEAGAGKVANRKSVRPGILLLTADVLDLATLVALPAASCQYRRENAIGEFL